jgi:hypothetical protein
MVWLETPSITPETFERAKAIDDRIQHRAEAAYVRYRSDFAQDINKSQLRKPEGTKGRGIIQLDS